MIKYFSNLKKNVKNQKIRIYQVHPGDWIGNQVIGCPNLGDPTLYQVTELRVHKGSLGLT